MSEHAIPATVPRESRWMIAYHFWAGVCFASATNVLFERHAIRLGALPMIAGLAVGYMLSWVIVRAINRTNLPRRWKIAIKAVLFIGYLPLVVVLAYVIGNATL